MLFLRVMCADMHIFRFEPYIARIAVLPCVLIFVAFPVTDTCLLLYVNAMQ